VHHRLVRREVPCPPEALDRAFVLAGVTLCAREVHPRRHERGFECDRASERFDGVVGASERDLHHAEIAPCPRVAGVEREVRAVLPFGRGEVPGALVGEGELETSRRSFRILGDRNAQGLARWRDATSGQKHGAARRMERSATRIEIEGAPDRSLGSIVLARCGQRGGEVLVRLGEAGCQLQRRAIELRCFSRATGPLRGDALFEKRFGPRLHAGVAIRHRRWRGLRDGAGAAPTQRAPQVTSFADLRRARVRTVQSLLARAISAPGSDGASP